MACAFVWLPGRIHQNLELQKFASSSSVFFVVINVATPAERRGRKASDLLRDGRAATSE